jgi:hypothetical protein
LDTVSVETGRMSAQTLRTYWERRLSQVAEGMEHVTNQTKFFYSEKDNKEDVPL